MRPLQRLPLLALGFVGLILGVGAGLARLGWGAPALASSVASLHGPLLVGGFLGAVIALERAVALGGYWAYLGPLLAGLGTLGAVAGAPALAMWCFLAGSLVLLAASVMVFRRQPASFTAVLALGALSWAVGNALWATGSGVHEIVLWWLAFPILTIAGERLELTRLLPPAPVARRVFAVILIAIGGGLLLAHSSWGPPLFGSGLIALSLWLLKQDIAGRTVRTRGLTRFIAVCLLSGYAWLAVGGGIVLAGGVAPGSASYDAALHALLLGFVFAMIFGHAPVIFPAVVRVAIPYHASFYAPLALLHVSLILRLAGDATGRFEWTKLGGMLNALALAAFIVSTVIAVVRGRRASGLAP
ncbi:MAG TPA: hypothetical protein VF420_04890 [Casimicrobiaceae bacterium]